MRHGEGLRMRLALYTLGRQVDMSFILDDSEVALPIFSDVCSRCKHWFRRPGRKCHAFPQGIPLVIWLGENDHRRPYAEDHGIRFTPVSDAVTVQPEAVTFSSSDNSSSDKWIKARKRIRARYNPSRNVRIRLRLWQDPQIREKITEIIKTDSGTIELQPSQSVEALWLDKDVPVKGKPQKKKPVAGK